VADQISDAILDNYLAQDPNSRVACETLVTTGLTVVAGEITSQGIVDIQEITRNAIAKIGYTKGEYQFEAKSCGVISTIHTQSPDISQGVTIGKGLHEEQGAGDQGMMFGYATNETDNYLPLPLDIAHKILQVLAQIRHDGKEMTYLRPDAKSQVTIEYNEDNTPNRVDTIVVSTQHDEFYDNDLDGIKMCAKIREDVQNILLPKVIEDFPLRIQALFKGDYKLHVNPTGKFVIGGPHGDTGLTGRKIIVDTYGGKGAHGGGAFSGKDPSKVDRSAAYAVRHIAKNMVAAGVANEMLVQVAYAIGVAEPVGIFVNTYKTANVNMTDAEIAAKIKSIFPLKPAQIIDRLNLLNPIYSETAAYGHFGRDNQKVIKFGKEVELFTWEKLDFVDTVKKEFNL
jgi:S-adenosylmethionine synthetase